jgi:hypothetical protein
VRKSLQANYQRINIQSKLKKIKHQKNK